MIVHVCMRVHACMYNPVCVHAHTGIHVCILICHSPSADVREEISGVSFLFLPCGSQKFNSDYQAWGKCSHLLSHLSSSGCLFSPLILLLYRMFNIGGKMCPKTYCLENVRLKKLVFQRWKYGIYMEFYIWKSSFSE